MKLYLIHEGDLENLINFVMYAYEKDDCTYLTFDEAEDAAKQLITKLKTLPC